MRENRTKWTRSGAVGKKKLVFAPPFETVIKRRQGCDIKQVSYSRFEKDTSSNIVRISYNSIPKKGSKMQSRKIIVAIEGLDGSGKSTIAHALGAFIQPQLNTIALHTPGRAVQELAFSLIRDNEQASFLAFMIGNRAAINQAHRSNVIILDRYIISTIIHHPKAWSVVHAQLDALMDCLSLPAADFTIFLDVPEKTAARRISSRADDPPLIVSLKEQRKRFYTLMKTPFGKSLLGQLFIESNNKFSDLDRIVESVGRQIIAKASSPHLGDGNSSK